MTPLVTSKRPRLSMEQAYVELLHSEMIALSLATTGAATVVFALIGPVGTFEMLPLTERLVYCAIYACVSWPVCYALNAIALYFLRFRTPIETACALTFVALFAALPCAAMVHTVESLAHPDYSNVTGLSRVYLLVAAPAVSCSHLFLYLVCQRVRHRERSSPAVTGHVLPETTPITTQPNDVSTPLAGGTSTEPRFSGSEGAPPDNEALAESGDSGRHPNDHEDLAKRAPIAAEQFATTIPPRQAGSALLKLLPERLGTDLVYIKSEDHYLEVHTTAGSSLVKMRFSEAVAELGDRGMQVHRSYWVATSHVTRSARSGKRTILRLTGDHKVPVSVTHLPAVRAALGR